MPNHQGTKKGKTIKVRCGGCGAALAHGDILAIINGAGQCPNCAAGLPEPGLTLEGRFVQALADAQDQVLAGKGAERHGRGRALDEQPIWRLLDLYGPGFAAGQAAKKTEEALGMLPKGARLATREELRRQDEAVERELLGAIAYLGFLVAWIRAGRNAG